MHELFIPPRDLVGYTAVLPKEVGERALVAFSKSEREEYQWVLFPENEWFFPAQRAITNLEGIPWQRSDLYGRELQERGAPFVHYHLHTRAGSDAFAQSFPSARMPLDELRTFARAYTMLPSDGDLLQYSSWIEEIGGDLSFAIASPAGISYMSCNESPRELARSYDTLTMPVLFAAMDRAKLRLPFPYIAAKLAEEFTSAMCGVLEFSFRPADDF